MCDILSRIENLKFAEAKPILTDEKFAKLIADRSQQIYDTGETELDEVPPELVLDAVGIALKEFELGVIPITIEEKDIDLSDFTYSHMYEE